MRDAKFTELEPTVYSDDELTEFFKHCDSWRTAIFKTYLMAGLRKAELENLTWDDVDLKAGTIRVSSKPDWQPKTWEERTIEIPDELVTILRDLPHRGKTVFANSSGDMYTHSWDDCKKIGDEGEDRGLPSAQVPVHLRHADVAASRFEDSSEVAWTPGHRVHDALSRQG